MLPPSLESRILTAFKQAVAEDQPDVADHLLRALETLCPEAVPGTPLAEAYVSVARAGKPKRRPETVT